jgi:Asp-tRNA(Asn)/Glu-tRNA(Gln) amidotransferase A subunit family amidase
MRIVADKLRQARRPRSKIRRRARLALTALLAALALNACAPRAERGGGDLDLIELTIDDAQTALLRGRITCEGLTRRYLARIAAYDPPPASADDGPDPTDPPEPAATPLTPPETSAEELNAIIRLNPTALDRARALDAEYARLGRLRRLHCIPVILKDNFDTADMPTEAGSLALAGSLPPDDAFMVRRLRAAGAIILAKSNMGEWAFSPYRTISATHGETRNAYDLARVPAGSSGGTASAIAANLGIIGMGTDTGNSIRGPASHLALVGIRSTLGATSRDGIVPLLANRDVGGPMLRTVRDTALVFSLLAGPDPADPLTAQAAGRTEADYTRWLDPAGLVGARLGVLRALVDTETADPEVTAIFEQALADLARAGAALMDPFEVPAFDELTGATEFCSRFRHDLAEYLRTLGPDAPIGALDDVVAAGQYLSRHAKAMDWAMDAPPGPPAAQDPPCLDVRGDPRRRALHDAVVAAMEEASVDAVVYPSWSNPPRRIGDDDSPHGNNSPVIAPHSGQPAISVPMGFTTAGLPLGLQLLARPFDEALLFRYAYAYEHITRHRRPPPGFGRLAD